MTEPISSDSGGAVADAPTREPRPAGRLRSRSGVPRRMGAPELGRFSLAAVVELWLPCGEAGRAALTEPSARDFATSWSTRRRPDRTLVMRVSLAVRIEGMHRVRCARRPQLGPTSLVGGSAGPNEVLTDLPHAAEPARGVAHGIRGLEPIKATRLVAPVDLAPRSADSRGTREGVQCTLSTA
jgi:hypothetical protein